MRQRLPAFSTLALLCTGFILASVLAGCLETGTGDSPGFVLLAPPPISIAIDPNQPADAARAITTTIAGAGVEAALATASPDLEAGAEAPGARLLYERVLVPVDRFSSLLAGISMAELKAVWTGSGTTPSFQTLYPDESTVAELTALLGPPGPAVKPRPAGEVADAVWSDASGLGILPFDALTPRTRAIPLEGLSAVGNQLQPGQWPLTGRTWLVARTPAGSATLERLANAKPMSNRDPDRLTVLTMTGTTALTRGTGVAIVNSGDNAWPARQVGADLAAADITTTSNEVSFVDYCVPDNSSGLTAFCAQPPWYATLEQSGIDIVGLTGNHVNDFGADSFAKTLDVYETKGIKWYGGGRNDKEAHAPLIVEHHGNRLAFIGANPVGPSYAWATEDAAGSATYDGDAMAAAIKDLRGKADVILAELQYLETDPQGNYQVEPIAGQREDFRALLDAGADVVTGIQAHAPQATELRGKGVILYGLGNLYFDQTWSLPTRVGLVARHTIYDHRLINTELLVTYIQDDMQVRWATPEERAQVLKSVFAASGW